jgi:ABC-2 type transport system permease protein
MISSRRLCAIARKEFLHVVRDWRSLVLAIAIPGVLVILFGYALNLDLNNVPVAVWDQSRTAASRDLLSMLAGSPYFSMASFHESYQTLTKTLDNEDAMLALVIPGDFATRIQAGRPTEVQVIAEGSDATTARLALSYASALVMLYNQKIAVRQMALMGAREVPVPVELVPRAWYNLDLRSENVIIPGIIAIVMIVIAAMLTSVTVAKEWEMGTMEQLISTPVRVPEIVVGKVIPYYVVGMADVGIAVAMGHWVFGVPLRGSAGLLFAMASVFLTGALFFGLMLGIALKKQVLANQAALLGSYLPTLLLSGYVFPVDNMPVALRYLSYLVPARYFVALMRGIFLKGIGLEIMWLNAVLLALYALIMIVLAHKRLKLKLG